MANAPPPPLPRHAQAMPFHEAVRTGITTSGLTLRSIERHMTARGSAVSVTTLSYWQSGQRTPDSRTSLRKVTTLEQVLGLPPASLSSLLPQGDGPRVPRRAARVRGEKSWEDTSRSPAEMRGLLAQFGSGFQDRLLTISHHEFAEAGSRTGRHRSESTVIVQARRVVDRYLFTYEADAGTSIENVEIIARDSCRLGRVLTDAQARIVVAELLFDRLLHPGETHVFRYEYRDDSPVGHTEVSRSLRSGADMYVLRVRFDPAALPVRCLRFYIPTERPLRRQDESDLFLDSHHTAHTVERSAPPGVYGIRWLWP